VIAPVFVLVRTSLGAGMAMAQDAAVRVYAAGSLREAMTEITQAFAAPGAPAVTPVFGPSELLRERIEKGEAADVFASADVGNAQALARSGRAAAPIVFARNRLCALVAPGVQVESETLLERMLDPSIKLGTSTPKADPAGDYAWQLFEKADKIRPGASAALETKALKLVGGPDSPQPPAGRSVYGMLIAGREADIFLTYCTNAIVAARDVSGARAVAIPDTLAVGASYALTVTNDAPPAAMRFALYVLSTPGQTILERYGFTPVGTP
jgi:molybdate transport system substrate-binding protein